MFHQNITTNLKTPDHVTAYLMYQVKSDIVFQHDMYLKKKTDNTVVIMLEI